MQYRVIAGAVPSLHNRIEQHNNGEFYKKDDILPANFPFEPGEATELIKNGFIEEVTDVEEKVAYTVTANYLKANPDCGFEVGQEIELTKAEAAAAKKLK